MRTDMFTHIKIYPYPEEKPKNGQKVWWVLGIYGRLVAGDFYKSKPRDCEDDHCQLIEAYTKISTSHWSPRTPDRPEK